MRGSREKLKWYPWIGERGWDLCAGVGAAALIMS